MFDKIAQQALIIGGSMTRMLAARIASGYFAQVTLLEGDEFPPRPEPHKGVPQLVRNTFSSALHLARHPVITLNHHS